MEENGEPENIVPVDRRAAWWSWPLIVASLLFIAWGVNFLPSVAEPVSVPVPEASASPADLAILKIQAQLVISSAALDPAAAETALKELREQSHDDRSIAAVALLEDFVAPEDSTENKTLVAKQIDSSSRLLSLTRKAISRGIDEEEREDLRRSLGWFAELAPGPGLENPPRGDAIRERAVLVLGIGGLMLSLVVLALIGGAVLLIIHVHRWTAGIRVNRFDPNRTPRGVMLECFALYLGLMVAGEFAGAMVRPYFQIIGYAASVIVPMVWPLVRGIQWREFRIALGLHKGRGWWREIGAGFVGYLAMLSVASIGIFLTLILTFVLGAFGGGGIETGGEAGGGQPPVAPQTHPIVGWIYVGDWKTRLMCLLLASGFAPLFEEIFFRGAMHRYLRGRLRFFWAALTTSLIFAALHPQGLIGIPALASIGIGLSFIREWRDSLVAPMVAHALNNGLLVGFLWLVL